jgi:hypothetical protein
MFKKDSKYRLHFLIVMFVVLLCEAVYNFYIFYTKKDGMSMIGGIMFGVMTILYGFDLYEFSKNKKRI